MTWSKHTAGDQIHAAQQAGETVRISGMTLEKSRAWRMRMKKPAPATQWTGMDYAIPCMAAHDNVR